MSQLPFQPAPFEPIRSYDKPQVLLGMALDGELTYQGLKDALFRPERLSPAERTGYVDRLKQRVGGGTFGDTLIELATNPLVWLSFATGPAGGSILGKAGKGLLSMKAKYSPYLYEHLPFLHAIKLSTPQQVMDGTKVLPVLLQIENSIKQATDEVDGILIDPLVRVLKNNGFKKGLDFQRYADSDPMKQKVKELNFALHAKLDNWDQDTVELIPTYKKKTGFALREVQRKALVNFDLNQVLAKYDGGTELVAAYKQALDKRYKDMFFDATGGVDVNKALRLYRGIRTPSAVLEASTGPNASSGVGVITELMGPEMVKKIAKGRVTEEQWLGWVKQVVEAPIVTGRNYMPRNLWVNKGALLDAPQRAAWQRGQSFVATKASVLRQVFSPAIDPDDLKWAMQTWGEDSFTQAGRGELKKSLKMLKLNEGSAGGINMRRIDAQEALEKYFKSTAQSKALYIDPPSRSVEIARKDTDPLLREAWGDNVDLYRSKTDLRGGESLADLLQEDYVFLRGGKLGEKGINYAQDHLQNIALPIVLDRHNVRHLGLYAGLQKVKAVTRGFVNSGLGGVLERSGEHGKAMVQSVREWADRDLIPSEARTGAGWIAKYLYTTHLGANMGSVLLNMSQPFILAATWRGMPAIAHGYSQAVGEMAGYMKYRLKQGFRPLTDVERTGAVQKFFKFSDVDGADLINITKDWERTLDNFSADYSTLGRAGKTEKWWDYLMKPFEKAEWLNRSVVAHATEYDWKRAGRDITRGTDDYHRMVQETQRIVQETQFGGTKLNTPTALLGLNPMFRQFLGFPIRSITGAFHFGPKLAESKRRMIGGYETDSTLVAGLADASRALGISAVVYEVGKGMLGVDPSRGLFAASVTDLAGDRFLQDGNDWVPIPPAVEIPIDMVRGVVGNDYDLLRQTIPRILPGGVAASKAIGVLPDLPNYDVLAGLPGALQKTWADYNSPLPTGEVPVFKADGSLLKYQKPSDLIMRGLGVDLNRFQKEGELDQMLLKNREMAVEYRKMAIAAYMSNDPQKAAALRQEYQKRTGLPLVITRQQLTSAIKLRTVPRSERILGMLPREARPIYSQMTQGSAVSREDLVAAETASQRKRREAVASPPENTPLPENRTFGGFQTY